MIDWLVLASALASAALVVGNVMAEEAAKIGARDLAGQFKEKFLRGYKAKQHEAELRDALQNAEAAFRAAPGITPLQADAVLTKVNALATNTDVQKQMLEVMLRIRRDDPALVSDELLRACGLALELRPALATFLYRFRLYFAQIKAYAPLMDFALELRAAEQRDETNAWLKAMAAAQGIVATSDEAQSLKDYLAHIREKHTCLSFLFVRPRSREATTEAELEAVFVPLQVYDPEAEEKARRKMERAAQRAQVDAEREELKPQTINDILPRYDCLLLKGAPGSGKTTLLRHLALAFANGDAKEKLNWRGEPLLPIFVPLRNFGQFLADHRKEYPDPAPGSLLVYIENHFRANVVALTPDFFRKRLDTGKCLILLDALDEVSNPTLRACVAQHANNFIDHYRRRGNRFVLSSRPKGYDEVAQYLPRPIVCTVQPLMPEGRAELIRKLCRALERDQQRASHDAATLLDEIPRKDKVDELSRNPLFCTTIVLVSKYRGATLPERRVDIFKEIIDLLLGFWDTSRYDVTEAFQLATDDGTGRAFRDVGEAVEAKHRALAHLAYWMQKGGRAETAEADALAQLTTFFRDREGEKNAPDKWSRGFLVIAHQRSGLFVEGAPNLYNFSHSNFREYLAATELVKELDNALVQMVLDHVGDAWWEETILLAMALKELGDPRRKMLVDEMLRGGHLLMAGKCAVDMGDRLAAPLREDLIKRLRALMQSARDKPTTRASAGEILDALGWLPDDLDAFVQIPLNESKRINEFWIAKYPVTCVQYQRFIDAGGYANEKYWRNQWGVDENGREKSIGDEAWKWWKWLKERGGAERRPYVWDNPRFHRAGYPVVGVTWYEAAAYCRWLTEALRERGSRGAEEQGSNLQSLISNKQFVVRLPTETEWMRAAGGDANERYAWGAPGESTGKLSEAKQKEIVLARANVKESEIGGTSPVTMYLDGARVTENGETIWDLAGNVWEWTGTLGGDWSAYVRGGSWYSGAERVTTSARHDWHRNYEYVRSGIRVVVALRNFPT
jgi:formylglycine-generating enzyme required for sulfatase activity